MGPEPGERPTLCYQTLPVLALRPALLREPEMRECVFPFLLEVSTKNSHAGVRALDPLAIAVAQFVQRHNPGAGEDRYGNSR